ncbi:hypothetical protein ONZ51_g11930 [Trametes cubensis]|uniref:Uncharacterized protein n=1 Tax=Trametes cubensis TaxID=1111947 RepID=A0AAD7TJ82_9APHY|nr:hypothetical protein ONZ51_g11930 [Trametes cubensis]
MFSLIYLVASLAVLACAQSADESPRVIDPHSQTIWTAGKVETVSWDTTGVNVYDGGNRPLAGQILLGYLINSTNQYLWADEPIATGFLLLEKQTQVIVPEVPTGTYFIALLGDSGNWSQLFKINNPSEPTGVAPPSSLVVSTVPSKYHNLRLVDQSDWERRFNICNVHDDGSNDFDECYRFHFYERIRDCDFHREQLQLQFHLYFYHHHY